MPIGNSTNVLISEARYEIIDRGVDRLIYDPTYETNLRKQYVVALDVWNLDHFWINYILATVFFSSLSFVVSFQLSKKEVKQNKDELDNRGSTRKTENDKPKDLLSKLKLFWLRIYGRSFIEAIDFGKDIAYCYTV